MKEQHLLQDDVHAYTVYSRHLGFQGGVAALFAIGLTGGLLSSQYQHLLQPVPQPGHLWLLLVVLALVFALCTLARFWRSRKLLGEYHRLDAQARHAIQGASITALQQVQEALATASERNPLVAALQQTRRAQLEQRLLVLEREARLQALEVAFKDGKWQSLLRLQRKKAGLPLYQARTKLQSSLATLRQRREQLDAEWRAAYANFSWWNKLKYNSHLDLGEMDGVIARLERLSQALESKHAQDFKKLEQHFESLHAQAIARFAALKVTLEGYIRSGTFQEEISSATLNKALWLSALSVPVSLWGDMARAGDIYDALRRVHTGFSGLSDTEIWWETLFMSGERLAGLMSLTKGAYFEQLVANNTGGQLHEHFNNPDTDIVIDGVAFQLKATDSEAYIAAIDDSIPVMATAEVAETTEAIDSGISNTELTRTVETALGGSVIDLGDTTVDAILTGVGGLGLFATLEGINHAASKYNNGGDGVEALFEGAGVAIEGTARGLVNAAEMSFNIVTSRPMRFVGRALYRGLEKLDKKLLEDSTPK